MTKGLPEEFRALEPLLDEWAFPTEDERHRKRASCTPEELRAFYDKMLPYLESILDHLDRYPLGKLPPYGQRLLYLTLSVAHAGLFVEVYRGKTYIPHAFNENRFITDADHLKSLGSKVD